MLLVCGDEDDVAACLVDLGVVSDQSMSMPPLLPVMILADTNLCEGVRYIDDAYVWFVSAGT